MKFTGETDWVCKNASDSLVIQCGDYLINLEKVVPPFLLLT